MAVRGNTSDRLRHAQYAGEPFRLMLLDGRMQRQPDLLNMTMIMLTTPGAR